MRSGDLPGGVYAEIDGHVQPARHIRGQRQITLIGDAGRLIDRTAIDRLILRTVSGRWRGEPVTVWSAHDPGAVRVQYVGDDPNRARALGMRGDRTIWELDVPPSEVTITTVEEVDLD
ncbi:MAG: hypothetical protein ABIR32_03320 [Ilumatobacteraceae bacterium]